MSSEPLSEGRLDTAFQYRTGQNSSKGMRGPLLGSKRINLSES